MMMMRSVPTKATTAMVSGDGVMDVMGMAGTRGLISGETLGVRRYVTRSSKHVYGISARGTTARLPIHGLTPCDLIDLLTCQATFGTVPPMGVTHMTIGIVA